MPPTQRKASTDNPSTEDPKPPEQVNTTSRQTTPEPVNADDLQPEAPVEPELTEEGEKAAQAFLARTFNPRPIPWDGY